MTYESIQLAETSVENLSVLDSQQSLFDAELVLAQAKKRIPEARSAI
jgi:hypothetical protein